MPLISLDIPAGVVRHGTESESAGRWIDANLMRWENGSLRTMGGWRQKEDRTNTASAVGVTLGTGQVARGMVSWKSNDGNAHLSCGTYNKLWHVNEAGTVADITPSNLTAGSVDAAQNVGYGGYLYGKGSYGVERPSGGIIQEATTWSVDSWGEYLVGVSSDDGKLYQWQLNPNNPATLVTQAPTSNKAIVVTEERFVFALASDGNLRKVAWCDQENITQWATAATNQAGDFELSTTGEIMLGIGTRGRTLILTTVDAFTATYQAPPTVYGFEQVGNNCGAISRHCAAAIDEGAFWMGTNGFFMYNGSAVQEIPCDVHDYVFQDINISQRTKTTCIHNGQFNEIWWIYPSEGSTENDRYVVYDYKEGHWNIGNLDRTSGIDAGIFSHPIFAAPSGKIYEHEFAFETPDYTDHARAETGKIRIGNGDNIMEITQIIPDYTSDGDVMFALTARNYPNDPDSHSVAHNAFTSPTDVRIAGREVRLKVRQGDWTLTSAVVGHVLEVATKAHPDSPFRTVLNGRMVGDVSGNGIIASYDALSIQRYIDESENLELHIKDYIRSTLIPFLVTSLPATSSFVAQTSAGRAITLGTISLDVKAGSKR